MSFSEEAGARPAESSGEPEAAPSGASSIGREVASRVPGASPRPAGEFRLSGSPALDPGIEGLPAGGRVVGRTGARSHFLPVSASSLSRAGAAYSSPG